MQRLPALALLAASMAPLPSQILVPGKQWELLGAGYQLTADTAVDPTGIVYFTDARKNRILKVDLDGKITTWKESTDGAHGVAFGPDGRLYAGQHDRKRIVAFAGDGTESVIAEEAQTHHLIATPRNEIYFTLPPARQVWHIDASGSKRVVHEGLQWPRAMHVTPDRSRLAVTDPRANSVWTFRIHPDGSLSDGRNSYQLENDADAGGIAYDSQGELYVATKKGVQVFDRQGRPSTTIGPPRPDGVSNVFFAGPGLQWLYVADWENMYRRRVNRRGANSPGAPTR